MAKNTGGTRSVGSGSASANRALSSGNSGGG